MKRRQYLVVPVCFRRRYGATSLRVFTIHSILILFAFNILFYQIYRGFILG